MCLELQLPPMLSSEARYPSKNRLRSTSNSPPDESPGHGYPNQPVCGSVDLATFHDLGPVLMQRYVPPGNADAGR